MHVADVSPEVKAWLSLSLSDFLSPSEILSLYRKKVIASIFPGSMRNVKRFLIATGPTDGPVIR